jgi:hypothetical protein
VGGKLFDPNWDMEPREELADKEQRGLSGTKPVLWNGLRVMGPSATLKKNSEETASGGFGGDLAASEKRARLRNEPRKTKNSKRFAARREARVGSAQP